MIANREVFHRQLFFYLLLLLVASMPFAIRIYGAPLISLGILALGLNWLIEGDFKNKWQRMLENQQLLALFTGFYLLHLAGMLYTNNLAEGWFNLEKKVPLLALPLILSSVPRLEKEKIRTIKYVFVGACLLATVLCLLYAVARIVENRGFQIDYVAQSDAQLVDNPIAPGYWDYFTYSELGTAISIHPTYFALYLLFCIFILAGKYFAHSTSYSRQKKKAIILLVVYLSLFLFMLSARIIIVAHIIGIMGYLVAYFYRKGNLYRGIFRQLLFMTSGVVLIWFLPSTHYRIFGELADKGIKIPDNPENWNSLNLRTLQWTASIEHTKPHWLLGVGTGDAQDHLNRSYSRVDLGIYKGEYNSHNQYLQTTLTIGMVGLSLWVAGLAVPAIKAFRQQQYLYLIFLLLFAFCCLTESMLQMHKGVVFYAFFNSLFAFHILQREKPPGKEADLKTTGS